MTTLADAQDVINRMKAARPTCSGCETRPFVASLREPDGPPGFDLMPHYAGYVKRCAACETGKLFPWADQLDPERVRSFMEALETDGRNEYTWELSMLEQTLPPKPRGGFELL